MVKVLFDTSVLIAALVTNHPQHSICFPWLKSAECKQVEEFVSTHTLAETYSVLTRLPRQDRITCSQAQTLVSDVLQYLNSIPLLPNDYLTAIAQMVSLNLPGGAIFDSLIAQAALKANVNILLTLNPKHFTRLGNEIANRTQVPQ